MNAYIDTLTRFVKAVHHCPKDKLILGLALIVVPAALMILLTLTIKVGA